MDVVVFGRGTLRLAVRADEVERFAEGADGTRSLIMRSGTQLRFDRARLLSLPDDALRPLPPLFEALAPAVGATSLLALEDELVLVISPDPTRALPDEIA